MLFAYRTSRYSITKYTPFYLVYGREMQLPFDKHENSEILLLKKIFQLEDFKLTQEKVQENIAKVQVKQKEQYDKNLKRTKLFKISDKVLLYDAAKEKSWTGKLNLKWKESFYIYNTLLNSIYKLKSIEGQILKSLINNSLLKLYHNRQNLKPIIFIE